ncbi:MAG TPA: hypothetical protein VFE51_04800, partial [Verrucomicrobiae bacterium]|nr:hypothetical protein [Verrucomicrobiae bacterium]
MMKLTTFTTPCSDRANPRPRPEHQRGYRTVGILLIASVLVVVVCAGAAYVVHKQSTAIRLRVATDRLYGEASKQRDILVRSIESYNRTFGFYPPDHVICKEPLTVEPVTNQLFYELLGTFHNVANSTYEPPKFPEIPIPLMKMFFGVDAFVNSTDAPEHLNHFLDITNIAGFPAKRRPNPVALVGFWPNWEGIDSDLYQFIPIASWRYNVSVVRDTGSSKPGPSGLLNRGSASLASFAPPVGEEFSDLAVGHRGQA